MNIHTIYSTDINKQPNPKFIHARNGLSLNDKIP